MLGPVLVQALLSPSDPTSVAHSSVVMAVAADPFEITVPCD